MTLTPEERRREAAAEAVLESVKDVPPATLRALATGLELGGLGQFASAFDFLASAIELDIDDFRLACANLTRALRRADHLDLLARIERHDEAPWPAIRDALLAELQGEEAA
jgi:hypothetical protein